jgi:hypothetical protein
MVLYILIYTFLDSGREGRRFWAERNQTLREFTLLLISCSIKCSFVAVIPKYLNCATTSKGLFAFRIFCPAFQ